MSNGMIQLQSCVPVPLPQIEVTVRPATMDDLAFVDGLQKQHTKMVGFMPTKQLEGKINAGHVLVAEVGSGGLDVGDGAEPSRHTTDDSRPTPVGYCIGNDQYFKHDDIGIIYQMNVVPGRQRGLIGATLLKAQFERSAYGCKLYCCWCAQDIEANRFWESMGFVPLAFRTGSRGRGRVHIFWQRRIRSGDTTTPYWFPSQTTSGSIREDRLVLPIPPGTHWSDAKPLILPGEAESDQKKLTANGQGSTKSVDKPAPVRKQPTRFQTQFGRPSMKAIPAPAVDAPKVELPAEKPKKQKVKNDPKHVAAARELRDRYLEQVNQGQTALPAAKYDVGRQIGSTDPGIARFVPKTVNLLSAA